MKYYFLIISLLVSVTVKSQEEENLDTYNYDNFYFPKTNIGKGSLSVYFGGGYTPYTGNLRDYYNPNWGATMSLDYYHCNNLTFSLSIMGALNNHLREDVNFNNTLWTPKDTADFWSYGLFVGYSIINKVHWRINPFGGIVLSQSKLTSPDSNEYKIGAKPSPVIGINFAYRFINVKKEMQRSSGTSNCFGINARIAYVPFAVNKKGVPFTGGIWYMTIGVTPINIFSNQ